VRRIKLERYFLDSSYRLPADNRVLVGHHVCEIHRFTQALESSILVIKSVGCKYIAGSIARRQGDAIDDNKADETERRERKRKRESNSTLFHR